MSDFVPDVEIKKGDNAPALEMTLLLPKDENGNQAPADLTNSSSRTFYMREYGKDTVKVEKDAAIVGTPTLGNVKVSWATDGSDTDEVGNYYIEVTVVWADGTKLTFPNNSYKYLRIYEKVKPPP
jgi:hypothetical protein